MRLILEDKTVYNGQGLVLSQNIGEVVVVNAMVGYQEIISDPDYFGKIVCLSYPLIGNYGLTDEDNESKKTQIQGLIAREYNDRPSNFRYTKTLKEVLEDDGVSFMEELDTRLLVNHLNEKGSMVGIMVDDEQSIEEALRAIAAYKAAKLNYEYNQKVYYSRTANFKYTVVALDLGIKRSLIHALNCLNVNVVVIPYNYDVEKIKALNPDGLLISSGPENMELLDVLKPSLKTLWGNQPMMAIGMGHLALAYSQGLKISKMAKGHYSCNHPIKELSTNKVITTVLANSYIVTNENDQLKVSHRHILDQTIEGLFNEKAQVMSFQGDIAGSNQDHKIYFAQFIEMMKGNKTNA